MFSSFYGEPKKANHNNAGLSRGPECICFWRDLATATEEVIITNRPRRNCYTSVLIVYVVAASVRWILSLIGWRLLRMMFSERRGYTSSCMCGGVGFRVVPVELWTDLNLSVAVLLFYMLFSICYSMKISNLRNLKSDHNHLYLQTQGEKCRVHVQ